MTNTPVETTLNSHLLGVAEPGFDQDRLYLAVGQPLGLMPAADGGRDCCIRGGEVFFHLSLEGYELWHLSLGGATHLDLETIAERQGSLADLADNLAFFREKMLLVEWHGEPTARELAPRLRVLPTGIGGGSDEPDSNRFVILSRAGQEECAVDFLSYVLWSYCDGAKTLAEAVAATAAHCKVPPQAVLERAGWLVPKLVRHGLAFLDLVGLVR